MQHALRLQLGDYSPFSGAPSGRILPKVTIRCIERKKSLPCSHGGRGGMRNCSRASSQSSLRSRWLHADTTNLHRKKGSWHSTTTVARISVYKLAPESLVCASGLGPIGWSTMAAQRTACYLHHVPGDVSIPLLIHWIMDS